jgi:DNA-binding transcriptional LysR family regulator
MPELRDLRAFVAVAEQLSFTRAADVLHLRQQTVSRIVRDLERELGVELLERTTRAVRVTAAGLTLLDEGRRALRQADVAFDAARAVGTGHVGTVRVGATPPVGITDRADVVDALRRDQPELSVSFRDLRPGDLRESLNAREVDFVLTRVSGTQDDRLHHAELRPTPMTLCVPASHPLANRDALRVADIKHQRLLTPSAPTTAYSKLLISRLEKGGATVTPIEAHVTGGAALLAELDRQDAIAIMPIGTATPDGVISIPIQDFTLPLHLLWPAGRPSDAIRRLREAMSERRLVA